MSLRQKLIQFSEGGEFRMLPKIVGKNHTLFGIDGLSFTWTEGRG
jgi:hypothetical protein